jgi:hypothetical protein
MLQNRGALKNELRKVFDKIQGNTFQDQIKKNLYVDSMGFIPGMQG